MNANTNKIKVIVKRPDEQIGHVVRITNTLKNLQALVGGYIEVVQYGSLTIICDEEGKIKRKDANCVIGNTFPELIVGNLIVCGTKDDDFVDVPITLQR